MNIALLGAGLMGRPMAERLKAEGHQVQIYNRKREKIADLTTAGISITDRPEEAMRAASVMILMLADAEAICKVLLSGPARKELSGRTVIQMSTIGPDESRLLQKEIVLLGGDYFEAPVLGSIAEVRAGKLIIMVGGSNDQFNQWGGLLRCLGPDPRLIGPVGSAATLKLALNQLIAAEVAAFSLSLGLVERAGIPVDTFMTILRESALYASTFDKKLPRLLERDYANPNFPTKHLLKDVGLILHEAHTLGLDTSSFDGMPALLRKAIERGLADRDYSALYNVINPPA